MLLDLHVHLRHLTDSPLEIRDIIARTRKTLLDGVVLTDDGYYEDIEELKGYAQDVGVVLLFGAEIHTDKGHMLIYLPDLLMLKRYSNRPQEGVPINALVKQVTTDGGAIVAAHPYKKDIDRPLGDGLFNVEGLTAIEVESGFADNTATMLAYDAAERLGVPMTGGSATKTDFENLGVYATLFAGRISTEEDLVNKLKKGRYYPVVIK